MLLTVLFAFGALLRCAPVDAISPYIVIVPTVLRAGAISDLSIEFLVNVKSVDVTVKLVSDRTAEALFQHKTSITGLSAVIPLAIDASVPLGQYTLQVRAEGDVVFEKQHQVLVEEKGIIILIQTDKPFYRPSEKVQWRCVVTDPYLMPYNGKLAINIKTSSGDVVAHWSPDDLDRGVYSGEFLLDESPPLGDWRIEVSQPSGDVVTRNFTVGEYELPLFNVKLRLPTFLTRRDKQLSGVVIAKYARTNSFVGNVSLTVFYQNDPTPVVQRRFPIDRLATISVPLPEGLFEGDPTAEKLLLLLVKCTVTDQATGQQRSDEAVLRVYESPVVVKFFVENANFFKPGLTYHATFLVNRPDGSAIVADKWKKLYLTYRNEVGQCHAEGNCKTGSVDAVVRRDGLVTFAVPTFPETTQLVLHYNYEDEPEDSFIVRPMRSTSGSFLQINAHNRPFISGYDVIFDVECSEPITRLFYQIVSRSLIVLSGNVTVDTSTAAMITFTVTPDMAPTSRLLVYYVNRLNEMIVDSTLFRVEGVFRNPVSVSIENDDMLAPGDEVTMSIETTPGSLVGLAVTDSAVDVSGESNGISENDVMAQIEELDESMRAPTLSYIPGSSFVVFGNTAMEVFENSGVAVLTDAAVLSSAVNLTGRNPYFQSGDVVPSQPSLLGPMPLHRQQFDRMLATEDFRRNLLETALFVNMSTTAATSQFTFQLPGSVASWRVTAFAVHPSNGLGIASPITFRTQRLFSIALQHPRTSIRNEEIAIQVVIFNGFDHALHKVILGLIKSPGFELVANGMESSARTVIPDAYAYPGAVNVIPPGRTKSFTYIIRPLQTGDIPLRLTAWSTAGAFDSVEQMLRVKPEGIMKTINIPVLIDARSGSNFGTSVFPALPSNVVKGSAVFRLFLFGDLLGPNLLALDSVVTRPVGCEEQSIGALLSNGLIARYLRVTMQLDEARREKLTAVMSTRGYQGELSFRHAASGGFSDTVGGDPSAWSTAFVVHGLRLAKQFVFVDSEVLEAAEKWLLAQRKLDGSFTEPASNRRSPVAVTAHVVASLLHGSPVSDRSSKVQSTVEEAVVFLERSQPDIEHSAPSLLAAMSYAMALTGNPESAEKALDKFLALHADLDLLDDVTAVAYALLSALQQGRVDTARPFVDWIVKHRDAFGGFCSTEVTIIAVYALTEWASIVQRPVMDLHVEVEADSDKYPFEMNQANRGFVQSQQMKGLPEIMTIKATGEGLALLQLTASCMVTADENPSSPFEIKANFTEDKKNVVLTVCTRSKVVATNQVVVDIGLPTGFQANFESLRLLPKKHHEFQLQTSSSSGSSKITLNYDQISTGYACVDVDINRTDVVRKSSPIYATVYSKQSSESRQTVRVDIPPPK